MDPGIYCKYHYDAGLVQGLISGCVSMMVIWTMYIQCTRPRRNMWYLAADSVY